MNSCITAMGQTFKNNLPLLEGIGQYGSLRSTDAGAPRYIGTRLSFNFRLIYKDFELLENKIEEGYEIEPCFFLPIIPTVIINGSCGIAIGYATNILNRNPIDVIDACVAVLKGKKVGELKPWLSEFGGTYIRDNANPNKWSISGIYNVVNTTTVRVTDLPPFITFEKYEEYLDSLVEKKVIVDYENNSSAGIDYVLKFTRSGLKEILDGGGLERLLKINGSETENLTTLDEHGHLKIFACVEELVEYFVHYRLSWYDKRKEHVLSKLETELRVMDNKSRFIKSIIDKKLKVSNVPKSDIVKWLESNAFDKNNGSYDYLVGMPIYSLTKEKYDELLLRIKDIKAEADELRVKKPVDMYLEDLRELRKKLLKK